MSSFEGVLRDFLTPILTNIDREPIREGLIDLNILISGNVVSVASKLRGGQHGHLALNMTAEEYRAQTGFAFLPPHNRQPGQLPTKHGERPRTSARN